MPVDISFIESERRRFERRFPREEGWIHHEVKTETRQSFLGVLPAFLRATLGGRFEERVTTDIGYMEATRGLVRRRLTALPWKSRRAGLCEFGWCGEAAFEWKASPIRVRRFVANADDALGLFCASHAFMACKDWAALADFFAAGLRFVRRPRRFKSDVFVVNGSSISRPKAGWDDIFLPNGTRDEIRGAFEAFLKARRKYKELGLPYRRGFLFTGPPGNGKTLATKVLLGQYRVNAVMVALRNDLDEKHIDQAFSMAVGRSTTLLILEDLTRSSRART